MKPRLQRRTRHCYQLMTASVCVSLLRSPTPCCCNEHPKTRQMAKYDPLAIHLKQQSASPLTLSFQEIEAIIGAGLPPSARTRREWWWNDDDPQSAHVQCRAWVGAGYLTERTDLDHELVIFRRAGPKE